ncbi:MAG: flavin reductase family protein [Nitrososphaerota archaeon]|nr:flavin reductase family protein [Nitrososphaerota archaeon]
MANVEKIEVKPDIFLLEALEKLRKYGLLLVSGSMDRANVMAIGWGLNGILWRKPFFMVAVRPSRYTFKLIEETGDFTINVPKEGMEELVRYCGTVSGRDHNKIKEKRLTLLPGKFVTSPIIAECIINYECRVAYKTKVDPEHLPQDISFSCYPNDDFHTLFFGEIVNVYVDKNLWDELMT